MKKFVIVVATLIVSFFVVVPAHAHSVSPDTTDPGGGGTGYVTQSEYNAIQNGWTKFHVEQTDFGGITGEVTDTCSNGYQYKRYAAIWGAGERYVWVQYKPSNGKFLVVEKGTMPLGVTIQCAS